MPVSTFCLGNWRTWPSDIRSYDMKTLFQISKNLPHLQTPATHAAPRAHGVPVVSTKISVSGPHGPVSPTDHQLCSADRKLTRSIGTPSDCQMSAASVSRGACSSPANTLTQSVSG